MHFLKNSIIYLGSSVIGKAIPFLLLPILTQYLNPEEYGLLSIFLIFISMYTAFIGMALHTNIAKNFFNVSKQDLAIIIGNIILILSISTIFYFIITLGIWSVYDEFFSLPTVILLVIPIIVFMQMINNLNTTILRNEERAVMFGVFEVSLTLIIMAVTILCLIVLGYGWYSQVMGIFTAGVIFCIIGFFYMKNREYIIFKYDKEKVKSILNISVPLIPHLLGGAIIAASDRLFIERMIGLNDVGLYSVGYSFGMIVMLFTDAFIKAWSPWFYKNIAKPTNKKKIKIVKYSYLFIFCLFITAILISIVAEFILPFFVNEKYYGASKFIFWIALGYAVRGVYQIFFPYLVHINKTKFLAISTVLAAIVNLILNYLFINLYGSIGAAYATVGAFVISALLVFWYQQKHYYMPWFKIFTRQIEKRNE